MGKSFFISDLHFGHKNVIRFDSRPFDTIEEMDNELIKRWNGQVTNGDTIYILGDISWYNLFETKKILYQLKGKKVLIQGNHDKIARDPEAKKIFIEIVPYKEIYINNHLVVLSHYPIMCWNQRMRGSIHLYGHVHNTPTSDMVESYKQTEIYKNHNCCEMYNVGCMMSYMNYTPQTLDTILQYTK